MCAMVCVGGGCKGQSTIMGQVFPYTVGLWGSNFYHQGYTALSHVSLLHHLMGLDRATFASRIMVFNVLGISESCGKVCAVNLLCDTRAQGPHL